MQLIRGCILLCSAENLFEGAERSSLIPTEVSPLDEN